MQNNVPPPQLEFALELRVTIAPTLDLGTRSFASRRSVAITGGTFTGPGFAGVVLPGGADWQLVESDGLTFLEARYVIETEDGVRIEVHNRGLRHGPADVMARLAAGQSVSPGEYYFRTMPCFFPPSGKYEWLRRSVFVGVAERYADLVIVRVWRVV
jgi:Protein of unknown function (DUF3237)